jgi:hypothetical protein
MKFAAVLAVSCAALLTGASAQTVKQAQPGGIAQQTFKMVKRNLKGGSAPPPRFFSNREKAAFIAKMGRLPALPTVGEPIALTLAKPAVAGIAYMDLYGVSQFDASALDSHGQPAASLVARMEFSAAGQVSVGFRAQEGKAYVADCRTSASHAWYLTVLTNNQADIADATAYEGHVMFLIQPSPVDGWVGFSLLFSNASGPTNATVNFWGCEVSPY